jgi:hypothetical protein
LTRTTNFDRLVLRPRRVSGLTAVALLLLGFGLTSCSVVTDAKNAVHDVEGNKSTVDAFTNKVKSGESSTFEATYMTTGTSPTTIVYAVQPPTGLSFTETPSGSGTPTVDLIVNSSGEYSCTPPSPGSGSGWSCQKLDSSTAASQNALFDFYTPAHWVTFLNDFSLAAGIAGDKVTTSSMTVNGFALQCVDFVAPGVAGTSTICTTPQDILGYVKVASNSTSFEITSYSASPPASLFQTPPGATITTAQTGTPSSNPVGTP